MLPTNSDQCDFCRNQPFEADFPEEAIGREYVSIDSDSINKIDFRKLRKNNKELLISFNIKEINLNTFTGKNIIELLYNLKKK